MEEPRLWRCPAVPDVAAQLAGLVVRRAGLTTAELEHWVGATLIAALLP